MAEVKIVDFKTLEVPARTNGDRVVGSFDCEFRGIRLISCSLLLRDAETLFVQLPVFRVEGRSGAKVRFKDRVHIYDASLMNALRNAACLSYEELASRQSPLGEDGADG